MSGGPGNGMPGRALCWVGVNNVRKSQRERHVCPISVLDSGYSPPTAKISFGQTVSWSFPLSNAGPHTVSDGSGMGLFDCLTMYVLASL